ncbi:MAG: patatin-like phospholipase family protein [Methyloceanibacter sp.]|nr:patatin-like phospholipase family protein [Methyloceanibacter sp.]
MSEKLKCDLVMRGGITSGIVYPRAIAELAKTYDFCSIGGTSAGAIAAAGTAAAALGRRKGVEPDPFQDQIATLPRKLGTKVKGKTTLERLFQPQQQTRALFRVLMSSLGHATKVATFWSVVGSLLWNYRIYALAGALAVFLPVLLISLLVGLGSTWWLVLGLALSVALIAAAAASAHGVYRDVTRALPDNLYGLCSGSSNNVADSAGILPLTDWLNDLFQHLAGRDRDDEPVTFGDLWDNGNSPEAARNIELVLMTTNVTRGVSQRFPFLEGSWGRLFFKEDEFAKLFPESVLTQICRDSEQRRKLEDQTDWAKYEESVDTEGYRPLPRPADLPIVLGARMSLSFPFLLSAVPLYAANFEAPTTDDGKFPLQRCWFSDGGLTSNFPLHFFDSPLPSRPTFGINLIPHDVEASEIDVVEGFDEEAPKLERVSGVGIEGVNAQEVKPKEPEKDWTMVWMPSQNSSGISSAARFTKIEGVSGFFSAMFDTARNWADTELMAMPGYRERVVHVKLTEKEGGLNLNMGGDVIEEVGDRGERAGELLAKRYAHPGADGKLTDPQTGKEVVLTWDNHRWIRYRATMAAVEDVARRFRSTWQDEEGRHAPWDRYDALLGREDGEMPTSYPFGTKKQRDFALSTTAAFVDFVARWSTPDQTFDRGKNSSQGRSPRPKPALRMMPLGSNDPRAERPNGADTPIGPDKGTV